MGGTLPDYGSGWKKSGFSDEHNAEPIVAANSGIAPGCFSIAAGPERLHSALGRTSRGLEMRMFGTSRTGEKSCRLMLGCFALLAFLGVLGGSMHRDGYSKSELFVIFGSLAVALYYLSQVLGWWKKHAR